MAQDTLFSSDTSYRPLAYKMRPKFVENLVGIENSPSYQAILNWFKLAENTAMRDGVSQARIPSILLWGPPGCGKTTIAELASELFEKKFIKIHAFDSGVKELRAIISEAKAAPNTIILFVDEVHNFNKSQQDALLEALESGTLTFIGATTENPAVSVNRALLSRVLKFELKAHKFEDHEKLIERASLVTGKTISDDAINYLIKSSYGDARALLNYFELAANSSEVFADDLSAGNEDEKEPGDSNYDINLELVRSVVSGRHFSADDNTYYDIVSALQKSMRGSDADASLYWLARLIHAGVELKSIARRIVVTASEDVGLADPQALVIAQAAYDAALHLGLPEARIPLAQAVAYIARAPKSNHAYKALDKALVDCRNHPPYEVPYHLRGINATCPAKSEKFVGENPVSKYKYPHDYPDSKVDQQYMPDELRSRNYLD